MMNGQMDKASCGVASPQLKSDYFVQKKKTFCCSSGIFCQGRVGRVAVALKKANGQCFMVGLKTFWLESGCVSSDDNNCKGSH